MSEFLDLVFRFLTSQTDIKDATNKVAVFVVGCAFLGMLAMIMDLCVFATRRTSLFDFKYTKKTIAPIFLLWTLGAAISGYFGQIFNVLQVTLLACATAGIGWPAIATKLIKDKTLQPLE